MSHDSRLRFQFTS